MEGAAASALPHDALVRILSHLSWPQRLALSGVCGAWRRAYVDAALWRTLRLREEADCGRWLRAARWRDVTDLVVPAFGEEAATAAAAAAPPRVRVAVLGTLRTMGAPDAALLRPNVTVERLEVHAAHTDWARLDWVALARSARALSLRDEFATADSFAEAGAQVRAARDAVVACPLLVRADLTVWLRGEPPRHVRWRWPGVGSGARPAERTAAGDAYFRAAAALPPPPPP